MKRIEIDKLPELKTSVGIHGATRLKGVGGAPCAGVIIVTSGG